MNARRNAVRLGVVQWGMSEVIGPLPQIAPKGSPLKIVAHINQLLMRTALRGRTLCNGRTNVGLTWLGSRR